MTLIESLRPRIFSMAASPRVRTAKALRSKRCSEKRELRARRRRPSEGPGLERRQAPVEPVLLGRHREQRRDLLRVLALAALAPAEGRVAEAPAARVADAAEDARTALGIVLLEPALEELVYGLGQAEEYPAPALRSRQGRGLQDAPDLGIIQPRDDGPDQHAHRHTGPREGRHRLEPPRRPGGPRPHAPRQLRA